MRSQKHERLSENSKKKKSPEKGVAATSLKVKMLDCFMGGFYTWDNCRCFR